MTKTKKKQKNKQKNNKKTDFNLKDSLNWLKEEENRELEKEMMEEAEETVIAKKKLEMLKANKRITL